MARDFWQLLRPVRKTEKIRKSLTLPAASYSCGFERGSFYQVGGVSPLRTTTNVGGGATAMTVDFRVKQLANISDSDYYVMTCLTSGSRGMKLRCTNDILIAEFVHSGGTTTINLGVNYYNAWTRFTLVFDGSVGYIYVDGVLAGSAAAVGSFTLTSFALRFGDPSPTSSSFIGYINELRVYNVAKEAESVLQTSHYRGAVTGEYDTGLTDYWRLIDAFTPTVGGDNLQGTSGEFVSDEYATIGFGASFVASQVIVDLAKPISFKYPMALPEGLTGALCVAWQDEDGIDQRRALIPNSEVALVVEDYLGEKVEAPFRLEWWNIDGMATIEIPEDVVVYISDTTGPENSQDHTAVSASAITMDTTLAEAAPYQLPMTFSDQQTYV